MALHFQGARNLEHEVRAEVALLAAPLVPTYALLDGHYVIEVKPAVYSKDSAVGAFMREAPFAGRLPRCSDRSEWRRSPRHCPPGC